MRIVIPIMIQDAPVSGTLLTAPLARAHGARDRAGVATSRSRPPGAASKLRELIRLGGDAIEGPWDGEEGITLMADLDAGATGAMTGGGYPDGIRRIVDAYVAGHRDDAFADYERWLPLINYRKPSVRSAGRQGPDEGGRRDRLRRAAPSVPGHASGDARRPDRNRPPARSAGAALGASLAADGAPPSLTRSRNWCKPRRAPAPRGSLPMIAVAATGEAPSMSMVKLALQPPVHLHRDGDADRARRRRSRCCRWPPTSSRRSTSRWSASSGTTAACRAQEMGQRIAGQSERSLTTTVSDIEHIESTSLTGITVIKVFFQPERQHPDRAGAGGGGRCRPRCASCRRASRRR